MVLSDVFFFPVIIVKSQLDTFWIKSEKKESMQEVSY